MKEYTYARIERLKEVEKIEGLSKDAAFEVARANSIVGKCIVYTDQGQDSFKDKLIKVWVFQNCQLTNEYIAGAEND